MLPLQTFWKFAILFLVFLLIPLASSFTRAEEPRRFECRWTTEPITIDGKADESAWQTAQPIDDWLIRWEGEGKRPISATRAKLLWDRDHLYFYAEMDDPDLFSVIKETDGMLWFDDVFELFFRPREAQPAYYEFQVNPLGSQLRLAFPGKEDKAYEKYKGKREFGMETKVLLKGTLTDRGDKDQGWTVEGKFPWTDFIPTGGRPEPGASWKFALCRYDYRVDKTEPELSSSALLTQMDYHRLEDYSELKFIGPDHLALLARTGLDSWKPLEKNYFPGTPETPPPYQIERVHPNLKLVHPMEFAIEPGTSQWIFADQKSPWGSTRICRTKDQGTSGEYDVILEFPEGVAYSFTFHPKFSENGFLYFGVNEPGPGGKKHSKVVRYTMDRQGERKIVPESRKLIIEWPSDGHNGAAVTFGKDGYLYITSGDGTSDSDTDLKGQGMDHLLAKLLRIDVDHPEGERPYSVPKDNPFVDLAGARPETWAFGFRNPWRITTDSRTGDIWVGQNGQDLWEQAYKIKRGANYGWSVYEGSYPFYPTRQLGPTPHVLPTVEHPHSEFRSLTGGVVYYGKRLPELEGAYIYGDYSTGKIWGIKLDGEKILWNKELSDTTLQVAGFALDAEGELVIVDHKADNGGLYTLKPREVLNNSEQFPKTLSQTGLFKNVSNHELIPEMLPYSVIAPLWSDGAHKERFLGLPKGTSIDLNTNRGWNLPDGSIALKSFSLPTLKRQWIETRILVKQEGEWIGYSYLWNKEQTDAELVPPQGVDVKYDLPTATGNDVYQWHFPSRTECMVCHSRAANYLLGLQTLQWNKSHDFPKGKANQLEALEALGLIRTNWRDATKRRLQFEWSKQGIEETKRNDRWEQLIANSPSESTALVPQSEAKTISLVDPYDASKPLDLRARSYLHANCAQCHVEAGGGNAQIQLEFETPFEKTKLFDLDPLHHKFDLQTPKLIAPGAPERSVLLRRLELRGNGQMPQLATYLVDQEAVNLVRTWILEMKHAKCK